MSRFRINAKTGLISVAPCPTPGFGSCIDYDVQSQYNLTVAAADLFGDGTQTSVVVYISIINEHTDPPVFQESAYFGSIDEYAPTLTGLLQVMVRTAFCHSTTCHLVSSCLQYTNPWFYCNDNLLVCRYLNWEMFVSQHLRLTRL